MGTVLLWLLAVYAAATSIFLISENRRPQATLAWLLVFIFAPVIGLLVYIFFGRNGKAFSKRSQLLMQDLRPRASSLLDPALARQDVDIARLETRSVAHRKLMHLVRRNSNSALTPHNRVDIQQNAEEFYANHLKDIEAARQSIHLQYFIWRSDPYTEKLANTLADKVKEGVEVRLLYDPVGSQDTKRSYFGMMRSAGIHVAPTTPLYRLHTISYRNHRKISVIDGVIGYAGGMNMGQEHLDGGKAFDYWRDTQVRIVGDGVGLLQTVFMVDWYNAVGENLFEPKYFPKGNREGDVPVQILTSGPDSQWAAIRQLYANMIVAAERHVFIQSPYFILDSSMAEALASAALSGVEVHVMLSARPSGTRVPAWAANTYIAEIVKSGVRVHLYEKGYLHAKTISIDSKICSIGSANIDIRSFSINYELNVVLYDANLVKELEQAFQRDLANCREFDAEAYAASSRIKRFRDSVARLFSPLL